MGVDQVIDGMVSAAIADWHGLLRANDKGKLLECWQNVYVFLDHHPAWRGVLALDTFAQRIVKRGRPPLDRPWRSGDPWTPEDDLELGLWLAQQSGEDRYVVKSKQALIDGVSACAMRHKFHPVREFLDGCRRAETPALDRWLTDYLGVAPSLYATLVGRFFLMNMVARIFDPGCIMRSVPVLEGAQDRGKSTALRELAAPWFSDSHFDLQSKDAFEVIQGVWLYEISEMEQFNKAEATRVKQFISSREDNYRPAYERRAVRIARQVCFGGSTNDHHYLKDWTGNTRFWPLLCEEVGLIRADALAEAREGLFAEARDLWRAGARRHPTREEALAHFEAEQHARRQEHPWTERVLRWIDDPLAGGERRQRVTVYQVLAECIEVDAARMTAVMARDVGMILAAAGWRQRRLGARSARERFYYRPEDPADGRAPSAGEPQGIRGSERVPGEEGDDPIPF